MKSLADLQKLREQAQNRVNMRNVGNEEYRVVVGMGTCGIAAGARVVLNAFMEHVSESNLNVVVTQTGCMGSCTLEPMVDIYDKEGKKTTYIKMNTEKVAFVVESHLKNGSIVEEYTVGKK